MTDLPTKNTHSPSDKTGRQEGRHTDTTDTQTDRNTLSDKTHTARHTYIHPHTYTHTQTHYKGQTCTKIWTALLRVVCPSQQLPSSVATMLSVKRSSVSVMGEFSVSRPDSAIMRNFWSTTEPAERNQNGHKVISWQDRQTAEKETKRNTYKTFCLPNLPATDLAATGFIPPLFRKRSTQAVHCWCTCTHKNDPVRTLQIL